MFPQIKVTHNIGNTIEIPNQLDIKVQTYLSSNIPVSTTSVLVDNASDFTTGSNIPVLLSSMGSENAEIVVSSAHSNTSITTGATAFLHNRGDLAQELKFDQIVISKSATINGSYSIFVTQTFFVTQQNTTVFDPAGLTSSYYKVQWKNSISGLTSDFSDPISVLSYPTNSVAQVIFPVLKAMGVSENDPRINVEFCISAINDARKYVKAKLYGIRHAWNQQFEFPIKVLAGSNYVMFPDDIDFIATDQSLLAARFLIGNVLTPYNLRYVDKRSWNQISYSVQGGFNTADVSIGASTITLNSTGDFNGSATGVAYVATTDFTQTILQIQYTGVDLVNNQLTGVTGVNRIIPAGTRIWSRPNFSQPITYTVFDDRIVFDRMIPDSMQGNNLYIDYYKLLDEVVNLYQILPENYRENYKWYLRWAIKYRKDIALPSDDPDLAKFEELVTAVFNNLYTGQDTIVITS